MQRKRILGYKNISGRRGDVSPKFLLIFSTIASVVVITSLSACFVSSPEDQIRRLIHAASKEIEKHHLQKSLSYVSYDYKDDGGFDYGTLAYTVSQVFRAYPKLTVSYRIRSISVQKDEAEVDVTAEVFGTSPSQEPEDLLAWRKSHRFLVTFKKIQKGWKVVATQKVEETE